MVYTGAAPWRDTQGTVCICVAGRLESQSLLSERSSSDIRVFCFEQCRSDVVSVVSPACCGAYRSETVAGAVSARCWDAHMHTDNEEVDSVFDNQGALRVCIRVVGNLAAHSSLGERSSEDVFVSPPEGRPHVHGQ